MPVGISASSHLLTGGGAVQGRPAQHPRITGTFRRGQRDQLQRSQRHLVRLRIPEPHSRHLHTRRFPRLSQRICGGPFGDQRLPVEDLEDAVKADQRGEDFQRQAGRGVQRPVQLRDQRDERHQRADLEHAVNDQRPAQPVHQRRDQRREQRDEGDEQFHAAALATARSRIRLALRVNSPASSSGRPYSMASSAPDTSDRSAVIAASSPYSCISLRSSRCDRFPAALPGSTNSGITASATRLSCQGPGLGFQFAVGRLAGFQHG
jgi:hypothetical protein